MSQKQRVHLTLEKKVEVIKTAKKNRTLTYKALGQIFGCGKTQLGSILKNQAAILESYEANASKSRAYSKSRLSEFSEVNDLLYEWYKLAC